jgi:UDPglucose--hexose-1-phosphate uridylyltransferase
MFTRHLIKPDGRSLSLYGRQPLDAIATAPAPVDSRRSPADPHLRWHPLRGEWVVYATHRQDRTFLPPPSWNPLAPGLDPAAPTEVPAGPWDVAVFENLFPALAGSAGPPPSSLVDTRPARGRCEVVVFAQDPGASLGGLPIDHLDVVLQVWAERQRTLGALGDVQYVFPFENRGVEVGVTLHHPHGQIYAYPFVPPIAARELDQQRAYRERHGRGLLEDHVAAELSDGRRMLYAGPSAVAFVPVCARYAYEVWVLPRRAAADLAELAPDERLDLARALQTALRKLDRLWEQPMPYVLAVHQAPTDGAPHPEAHVHIEIFPAYRMRGRLKYLAGSEVGAGVFTADTEPERKAAELQAVEVTLD